MLLSIVVRLIPEFVHTLISEAACNKGELAEYKRYQRLAITKGER